LNRQYDGPNDAVIPQTNVTVRLRNDLFPGHRFRKATLHAPGSEPIKLKTDSGNGFTSIKIPKLGLWTMLQLTD
jgi:hypothetical protein